MATLQDALAKAAQTSLKRKQKFYLVPAAYRGWVFAHDATEARHNPGGYVEVDGNHGRMYGGLGKLQIDAPIFGEEQMFRPTCHRDGTVTYWSVYRQQWIERADPESIPDAELAAMTECERRRIERQRRIAAAEEDAR